MTFSMGNLLQLIVALGTFSSSLGTPMRLTSSGLNVLMSDCYDYEIPVTTQTEALIFGIPAFSNNYEVAAFVGNLARRDASTSFNPFSGKENYTGNYIISATFCQPKTFNGHEKTILLATHGLCYDRRYWDSAIDPDAYSFVDYAVSKGYSIFFYDRLGTGKSTKVSGYGESQASNQLAILASLTNSLKAGRYTGSIDRPSKIVHVGHSFGSFLSNALIAAYPDISDGVILTGIGYDKSGSGTSLEAFRLNIADTVSPGRYPGRDSGYLFFADTVANAASFFHPGTFSKEILWYTQDIGQPLSAIELSTLATLDLAATSFTGPVMIISGEFDFAVCGGNCTGVLQHPAMEIFGKAKSFEAVVHPGVGHGINFSFNATGAYSVIMDFVTKNGL